MGDVRKELLDHGLSHVGWMRPGACPGGRCRLQHEPLHYHAVLSRDIQANVVYALLIDGELMKCGKAGSRGGSLQSRMENTIAAGNQAWLFAEGRLHSNPGWTRRKLDVFKQRIPDVIRAGQEIEIYAGEFTPETFERKELELNLRYSPPWVQRPG